MPINYPGTDYHTAALEASRDEQWTEAERRSLEAIANYDPMENGPRGKKGSPYWKKDAGSGTIFGYGGHGFLFHYSANGVNIAKCD